MAKHSADLLNLFHGRVMSAFIARPSSAGTTIFTSASFNSCCLSSLCSILTPSAIWIIPLPPLTASRCWLTSKLHRRTVFVLAISKLTRDFVAFPKVRGYNWKQYMISWVPWEFNVSRYWVGITSLVPRPSLNTCGRVWARD